MNRMFLFSATVCLVLVSAYNHAAVAQIFLQSNNEESDIFHKIIEDKVAKASNLNHLLYINKEFYIPDTDIGEVLPTNTTEANMLLAESRPRANQTPTHTRKPSNENRNVSQSQEETTRINLDSRSAKQPHNLLITTDSGTQLNAEITVNGRVVKTIRGRGGRINLSNCFTRGRHTIEIYGNYKPANNSVKVEFSGAETTVAQSTAGSGILRQTLIVEVE
ncbi:hypothetical protein [Aerosakkonema funiforme]|uniref:hypothetical protein n=1 Tax=Aerosakkonema funiforme TaxID=1246630 RepID=UPI0035BB6681